MPAKKHYHVQIRRNGAVYGTLGPYAKRTSALTDAATLGAPGVTVDVLSGGGSSCSVCPGKAAAKRRRNTSKWIQKVDKEIEKDHTEGAFTRQARRAGYANTMEFARKVMAGWRSGKRTVYNKKTRKQQRITTKTMRRANFAINVQKRRNPCPPMRANNPAVASALRLAAPYLIQAAVKMGGQGLRRFAKMSEADRIKAVRKMVRYSLPLRMALKSDAAAAAVADALMGMVESGDADKALQQAATAAHAKAGSQPLSARKAHRLR